MSDTIYSLAMGFNDSYFLNGSRNEENIIRQGRSKITALVQYYQIGKAISIFENSLALLGKAPLRSSIKIVCFVSPFLITWGALKGFSSDRVKKIVNFAHDHISLLAHAITFISIAILFIQGNILYASAYIGWTVVTQVLKSSCIPETVRKKILKVGLIVGCCTGVFCGDWLDKIASTIIIIDELANRFLTKKKVKEFTIAPEVETKERSSLTYEKILKLSLENVEVDPTHMQKEVLPFIPPETNPKNLLILFKAIPWKAYEAQMALKLKDDRRWCQVGSQGLTSLQYIEKELNVLIEGIVNRSIKVGPPSNYGRLQYYLQYITFRLQSEAQRLAAERLKKLSESDTKTLQSAEEAFEHLCVDSLLHLAVGGGTYCGLGEFQAVANVFYSLLAQDKTLSLKDRIYVMIQIERQHVMDSIYFDLFNKTRFNKFLGWLIDWNDNHSRSYVYASAIDQLGLMQDGAQEEIRSKFDELLFAFSVYQMKKIFKMRFDKTLIIRALYDLEGTALLPVQDLVNWWVEWTEKNQRLDLQMTLAESPSTFGDLVVHENITIDETQYEKRLNLILVIAMLSEMRVFRDKQP